MDQKQDNSMRKLYRMSKFSMKFREKKNYAKKIYIVSDITLKI